MRLAVVEEGALLSPFTSGKFSDEYTLANQDDGTEDWFLAGLKQHGGGGSGSGTKGTTGTTAMKLIVMLMLTLIVTLTMMLKLILKLILNLMLMLKIESS